MPFVPGNPGRPPGAINKRSKDFLAVLEKHNFDAAEALIDCYREARKIYDNYGTIYDAICEASEERAREKGYQAIPPEDKADKYLKIAADIAKDLAGYSYPKLKAIEQTKEDPLSNMTAEQKLEAAKAAVQMLELQIHGSRNAPGNN